VPRKRPELHETPLCFRHNGEWRVELRNAYSKNYYIYKQSTTPFLFREFRTSGGTTKLEIHQEKSIKTMSLVVRSWGKIKAINLYDEVVGEFLFKR
jgi:hypothetical protein